MTGATDSSLLAYANDPVGFVVEVLGRSLWPKQAEVLKMIAGERQVVVRSGHGVGKTYLAGCASLWWVYTRTPSLLLTTAPAWRQVVEVLWRQIGSLHRKSAVELGGRMLTARLEVSPDQLGFGFSPQTPEAAAGLHEENLLMVFEEASGIRKVLYEALQGTMTSEHCHLLLIGNPTKPSGPFYDAFKKPGWVRNHISCADSPNVTVKTDGTTTDSRRPLPYPALVTSRWIEDRAAEWGRDSDAYRVRVLGEFPGGAADSLIRLEWVEAAEERRRILVPTLPEERMVRGAPPGSVGAPNAPTEPGGTLLAPLVYGLDVARYGDCETVLVKREGDWLTEARSWQHLDLMRTVGQVAAQLRGRATYPAPVTLVVDGVGVGGGVVDRLRELIRERDPALLGVRVVSFGGGETAFDAERYCRRRDEAFWQLRERYSKGELVHGAGLGMHALDRLREQLVTLSWGVNSRGQIEVSSKEKLRAGGTESPDWADAVSMAFALVYRAAPRPAVAGVVRPIRRL